MPSASVLVVDAMLNPLGEGSKKQGEHFRVMIGILLDIAQESLNLNFCEFVREVRERTGLTPTLERAKVEHNFFMVFRQKVDEGSRPFSRPPEGRERISWLDLKCYHIRPTRDEVSEVRWLAIY